MVREELFVLKSVSPLLNSQTDEDKNLVARLLAENNIIMLRSMLMERPKLDVQFLENNDGLTRFHTGIPTYDSFLALIEF